MEVVGDAGLTDAEKLVIVAAMTKGVISGPVIKKPRFIINYSVYEIVNCELVDVDPPTEINKHGEKKWKDTDGKYHRDNDLPAIVDTVGNLRWFQHGVYSRKDGKPTHVYIDGTLKWCNPLHIIRVHHADGSDEHFDEKTGKLTMRTAATYPATYYFNEEGQRHNGTEPTIINGKKIWYEHNMPVRIE